MSVHTCSAIESRFEAFYHASEGGAACCAVECDQWFRGGRISICASRVARVLLRNFRAFWLKVLLYEALQA